MKVRVVDKWYECSAGDRLLISDNQEHEAVVGDKNALFWSKVLDEESIENSKCKTKNDKSVKCKAKKAQSEKRKTIKA